MNKKVALINSPSPFLMNERVTANTGLLHVATEMRDNGIDVEVFDFCGEENYREDMGLISERNFDVYGFSSTSAQFTYTYELLNILKRNRPGAFTVIGGAHASSVSSLRKMSNFSNPNHVDINIKRLEAFDLILEGDGELAYEEIFKNGPKWRTMPLIKDLDSIAIQDRSFIDIKSYHFKINGLESASLVTQRGCPFQCNFCCGRDIPSYRTSRVYSPQRILEEMDYLNGEFGFEAFMWQDDEVNLNRKRIVELSKVLGKRDYIHRGLVRCDLLARFPETAEALAEIGFVELCSGIESGSDKVLKAIAKGTSVETNYRGIELAKKNGMRFKAFTMLGMPSETYEDILLTKEWLLNAKPDNFDIAILQPYPGARIYDASVPSTRFKEYGYSFNDDLFFDRPDFSQVQSFYKGIPGEYQCSIRTKELTSDDFIRIRDEMEAEVREKLSQENIISKESSRMHAHKPYRVDVCSA